MMKQQLKCFAKDIPFGSFLFIDTQVRNPVFWACTGLHTDWEGDFQTIAPVLKFLPRKGDKQLLKYFCLFFASCSMVLLLHLMLDSKCFSLLLMLPSCFHKKLLLKWGDAGCEKVICLHYRNCVCFTNAMWLMFVFVSFL